MTVKRRRTADVYIHDQGTIIGFAPMTEAAQEWFEANVASKDWQWLHDVLCVDRRFASDLISGLEEASFIVEFR